MGRSVSELLAEAIEGNTKDQIKLVLPHRPANERALFIMFCGE
ncbi:hypothetical protein [Bacillus tequilensis]|nr:hypothetical protein [Bacillus tequilensis]